MSTEKLRQAVTANKEQPTLLRQLAGMQGEIARALPKHLKADRMLRIAQTTVRKNPKLLECDPYSFLGAVIVLSQLGLEPDVLGQAYLVPYYDKRAGKLICTPIPGWQGYVDLVSRAGRATVWTGAALPGDDFDYQMGDNPFVHHKNTDKTEWDSPLTHAYGCGRIKGADLTVNETWPAGKIWRHRDRFNKLKDAHYSFQHPEMYARKVPLLQVIKYMPKSVELQTAYELDDGASAGMSIDMKQALDGSWAPPPEATEPENNVDTSTGEVLSGKDDRKMTVDQALEQVKAMTTAQAVEEGRKTLKAAFGGNLPTPVDGALTDRIEAIKQQTQEY